MFRYLQPKQPSALLQLRREGIALHPVTCHLILSCLGCNAAACLWEITPLRWKKKKKERQSHLDWYIHEVTRAHDKHCAVTGFHSYCMLSLMNLARGSLWRVPVTFQHAAVFSVHMRANKTLNVSFPVLENSCCRDSVTGWGIKPLLFLPLKYLTPFRLPRLYINTIILFTPSDPCRWFTESRCTVWMVGMEIPCNTWTFFHPSEQGQKFKRQDVHFFPKSCKICTSCRNGYKELEVKCIWHFSRCSGRIYKTSVSWMVSFRVCVCVKLGILCPSSVSHKNWNSFCFNWYYNTDIAATHNVADSVCPNSSMCPPAVYMNFLGWLDW